MPAASWIAVAGLMETGWLPVPMLLPLRVTVPSVIRIVLESGREMVPVAVAVAFPPM